MINSLLSVFSNPEKKTVDCEEKLEGLILMLFFSLRVRRGFMGKYFHLSHFNGFDYDRREVFAADIYRQADHWLIAFRIEQRNERSMKEREKIVLFSAWLSFSN